jgi:hypothetical protein
MKVFANFRSAESDPTFSALKEKYKDKPITFFYDSPPKDITELSINPINIIMVHEPDEFFGIHSWVKTNHELYSAILTWNKDILDNCPNAILFSHSCNYLDKQYIESFKNKDKIFEVSFLSGAKSLIEGHKLRQEIYKIENQITVPKKWFYTLEDFNQDDFNKGGIGRPNEFWHSKKICFNESIFHVCVENTKQLNWFTEKISDAFNTKTIPIYWGCPNISDFGYDERGIIRFNTVDELIYIINNLTEETYKNMKPYIDYNYNISTEEISFKDKLEHFFLEFCNLNNI